MLKLFISFMLYRIWYQVPVMLVKHYFTRVIEKECHHQLISCDVPMTNIRREPCGGWMIVLFMVVSFVIRCVDRMCQSFFSECLFFHHNFRPCRNEFLAFPCLWEISFSSQMISGTVSWLLGLDRIFK